MNSRAQLSSRLAHGSLARCSSFQGETPSTNSVYGLHSSLELIYLHRYVAFQLRSRTGDSRGDAGDGRNRRPADGSAARPDSAKAIVVAGSMASALGYAGFDT